VHFYLPADHGEAMPLNWVLSDRMANFIWNNAFADEQVGNATKLLHLQAALAPEPEVRAQAN
jgi:hypothetical protein